MPGLGIAPMVSASKKSNPLPAGVPPALGALLRGVVDYAGLFPPAKLSLKNAVSNFVRYASGPHSWMLGKFVVPAAQLGELGSLLQGNPEAHGRTYSLSVLLGANPVADAETVLEHLRGAGQGGFSIDAVEFLPNADVVVTQLASVFPQDLDVFCEIPFAENVSKWLDVIRRTSWSAKMRTGGTTQESFPPSSAIASFLAQCNDQGVAFKATAGLHHPVRSQQPLTYERNSVCGVMHGFLNVFLGAALLQSGIAEDQLTQILDDTHPASFQFSGEFAHWRKLFLSESDIAAARERFAISFGSCSFEEPIQDLQKLGLL